MSANAHFKGHGIFHFSKVSKFSSFSKTSKSSIHCKKTSSGTSHTGLTPAEGYAIGGMFCSAIWLIAHGYYVGQTEHRQLTYREAYRDVAGCWIPIIGPGWSING